MYEFTQKAGVVVAVDGSAESGAAVRWAAHEAVLRRDHLTIVSVVSRDYLYIRDPATQDRVYRWQRHHCEEVLQRAEAIAADAEGNALPDIRTDLIFGKPVPVIVDISKDSRVLVVGRRGLGTFDRLMAGSVSSDLARHAHCPVAVVQDEPGRNQDGPVIVGIDGSPISESAIALAFDEASHRGVPLVAMHAWVDVLDTAPEFDWRLEREQANELLGERLAGWQERYPDVKVIRKLVKANPGRWLIEHSRNAQLVVVGSHGRGGFAGMLLGSVSRNVLHASHSPVIVTRGH
ncbi:universal stress protein [Mycobacteroides chelonae]|uniref:Universal stress protein n=2 Tax=Mycobacteroides chelonae TaxID=1774 RepID=A0AB73M4M0_MYCCH|nr:universal stress protein [Mycobacteroides chelonae]MBF9326995.1 universal stress protein [Mycobacteroides chelonae]MBF9421172.1 universal stress protein [Mycobacteroides chelonae]MBF9436638.1 universal stress protein [Mycobacteroides chelonae]MBV6361074.1 universal stress protein [Mycobacteroides chelonae]MEC4833419.1 universal stress protein [Mycobacteroides chelonae]